MMIMKAGEQNNKMKKFNVSERLKSFRSAFSGLITLLRFEHNTRIHLFILILVVVAGIFFRITAIDWIAIVFATGLVFASECFNTAIEYLSDVASPEYNEKIKKAKDVTAAGVLISAFVSVVIGLIIFLPEIIRLFRN
jgi:diacylglycerol kinase